METPGPSYVGVRKEITAPCAFADSVDNFVQQQMNEKHIPGAVLIALKDGKVLKQRAYGVHFCWSRTVN